MPACFVISDHCTYRNFAHLRFIGVSNASFSDHTSDGLIFFHISPDSINRVSMGIVCFLKRANPSSGMIYLMMYYPVMFVLCMRYLSDVKPALISVR